MKFPNPFTSLVGHRITVAAITLNHKRLCFVTPRPGRCSTKEGGRARYYAAYGDCCSESWIEHVTGADALLHGPVRSTSAARGEAWEDGYDFIRAYSYTISTDRGRCEFELRNRSNGYYGGQIEVWDAESVCDPEYADRYVWHPLTDF